MTNLCITVPVGAEACDEYSQLMENLLDRAYGKFTVREEPNDDMSDEPDGF